MIEEPGFTKAEKTKKLIQSMMEGEATMGNFQDVLEFINGQEKRYFDLQAELEAERRVSKMAMHDLEREHENYLSVHRDNMKAVERIVELKDDLERANSLIGQYELVVEKDIVAFQEKLIQSEAREAKMREMLEAIEEITRKESEEFGKIPRKGLLLIANMAKSGLADDPGEGGGK